MWEQWVRDYLAESKQYRGRLDEAASRTVEAVRNGDTDRISDIISDLTGLPSAGGENRDRESESGGTDGNAGIQGAGDPSGTDTTESGS